MVKPDPDTPSIIGGGIMFLTGPCFSVDIENITCLFTDQDGDVTSFTNPDNTVTKRIIKGITVNEKAVCPLPLFRRLGDHNVTITLGDGTKYAGSFIVGMLVCSHYMITVFMNSWRLKELQRSKLS